MNDKSKKGINKKTSPPPSIKKSNRKGTIPNSLESVEWISFVSDKTKIDSSFSNTDKKNPLQIGFLHSTENMIFEAHAFFISPEEYIYEPSKLFSIPDLKERIEFERTRNSISKKNIICIYAMSYSGKKIKLAESNLYESNIDKRFPQRNEPIPEHLEAIKDGLKPLFKENWRLEGLSDEEKNQLLAEQKNEHYKKAMIEIEHAIDKEKTRRRDLHNEKMVKKMVALEKENHELRLKIHSGEVFSESNKKSKTFFFSLHAIEKLEERSTLKPDDVLNLLERDLCIPVGQDKHRVHQLIFSLKDNIPLVVVFDERNKEIITVLYVDYNNKFTIDPSNVFDIRNKTIFALHDNESIDYSWMNFVSLSAASTVNVNINPFIEIVICTIKGDTYIPSAIIQVKPEEFGGTLRDIRSVERIKRAIEIERIRENIPVEDIARVIAKAHGRKDAIIAYSELYNMKIELFKKHNI